MRLPEKTSKLLDLQRAAEGELKTRFSGIFNRHRGLAFAHRQDALFVEHWTPERAASGYEFAGYEIRNSQIILYGQESAHGFNYRISIAFPVDLADHPADVDQYFTRQYAQAGKAPQSTGVSSPKNPAADD
jgi:hypothetical protein